MDHNHLYGRLIFKKWTPRYRVRAPKKNPLKCLFMVKSGLLDPGSIPGEHLFCNVKFKHDGSSGVSAVYGIRHFSYIFQDYRGGTVREGVGWWIFSGNTAFVTLYISAGFGIYTVCTDNFRTGSHTHVNTSSFRGDVSELTFLTLYTRGGSFDLGVPRNLFWFYIHIHCLFGRKNVFSIVLAESRDIKL